MNLKRKQHKGQNGKVLVIGGSEDYPGAVILASIAALRTGVDIVTVCAPEKVSWTINNYCPDIITKKFLGKELDLTHAKEIIALSENFDCILIGNGLGIKKDFVNKIIRSIEKPKVIDADAIKVANASLVVNAIFTPHIKEFEILTENTIPKAEIAKAGKDQKIKEMQDAINDNIILLKGKEDLIFGKDKMHQNKTGNNSMTVGGTGDILAGLCAGFLAQTNDLFESAKKAAYINGKAGEHMYKQKGYCYFASEMLEEMWRFIK
ncbi:NAD(P)H-hydrate dehydratase [Candidatus Woesearchaeota archaeon]|nr:NAD(P)H-hydrate dehydratase [Candidatus Woesearchaeota archaeon]